MKLQFHPIKEVFLPSLSCHNIFNCATYCTKTFSFYMIKRIFLLPFIHSLFSIAFFPITFFPITFFAFSLYCASKRFFLMINGMLLPLSHHRTIFSLSFLTVCHTKKIYWLDTSHHNIIFLCDTLYFSESQDLFLSMANIVSHGINFPCNTLYITSIFYLM